MKPSQYPRAIIAVLLLFVACAAQLSARGIITKAVNHADGPVQIDSCAVTASGSAGGLALPTLHATATFHNGTAAQVVAERIDFRPVSPTGDVSAISYGLERGGKWEKGASSTISGKGFNAQGDTAFDMQCEIVKVRFADGSVTDAEGKVAGSVPAAIVSL
jgi:hypothetical protein